jgi:uncharacterized repeat protein (TIGR03803 family)
MVIYRGKRGFAPVLLTIVLALNCQFSSAFAQSIQPIYTFNETQGAQPEANLLLGPNGNFYGTTFEYGSFSDGTVFEVTTNGALTTLASFTDTNGLFPNALTLGPDGNVYGTAKEAGDLPGGEGLAGDGTVFEVTTNGALNLLLSFAGTNGSRPEAALTLGPDGNFYGTTTYGGSNDDGTVFEVTTNGVLTTLASFAGTNGENPEAALALGPDGNFYGTTHGGGLVPPGIVSNRGTVFKVTTNGVLTMLVTFADTNGMNPEAALALGPDGNLYGTTYYGGKSNQGTVFKIATNGALTVLHSLTNSDGEGSVSGLTLGPDGKFYGTMPNAPAGYGTVFEITTNGVFTTLARFSHANGAYPHAGLTLGPDGNFYGTTTEGGPAGGVGVVYRLDLPPEIIQQPTCQFGLDGSQVTFSTTLFGTAPYSLQWLSNNVPITAATNSALTVSDITSASSGNYSVLITNTWGSITSSAALLTVVTGSTGFPPQIQSPSATNGSFIFSWPVVDANPPVGYQVQYTTNLASGVWTNIGGVITNGNTSFTNSVDSNSQGFYRVQLIQ